MYSNIKTKNQIIKGFSLWLIECTYLSNADVSKTIALACELLKDGIEYDYRGHSVLFDEINSKN